MHLIVEGNAQVVYDDALKRAASPSVFCRELQRPKDLERFKFGNNLSPEQQLHLKWQNSLAEAQKSKTSAARSRSRSPMAEPKKLDEQVLSCSGDDRDMISVVDESVERYGLNN